ncbi:unnamed protein product [Acanthoscelides obtectus]|uniref:Uncharacterized protein n=1 Tax=Acanthoscelides obtectus TaxID=200917 RepID=A0A9P0PVT9_ACAOB|nr:unnamed protein product [Acanthoscelides obtectus]CAK1677942.1 hypothetical protein AOBTE_LOCUS31662 [Acanthoscelides obtectus]
MSLFSVVVSPRKSMQPPLSSPALQTSNPRPSMQKMKCVYTL